MMNKFLSRKMIKFIFLATFVLSITYLKSGEKRDPFLSPFSPKKILTKEKKKTKPTLLKSEHKDQSKIEHILQEAFKSLESGAKTKAEEHAKKLKEIPTQDMSIDNLNEAEKLYDEISNFEKDRKFLEEIFKQITVQGKVILEDKPNILLINSFTASEKEVLSPILKIPEKIILDKVTKKTFTLRYKHISIQKHFE